MTPPTAPPPTSDLDRLRHAIEALRRKHFAAAERHRLAVLELDEYSDESSSEERRWHRDMAELHEDIAADLVALVSPSAIAVAELRASQKLEIARQALALIARTSRDEDARDRADTALGQIGGVREPEKVPF